MQLISSQDILLTTTFYSLLIWNKKKHNPHEVSFTLYTKKK